MTASDILRAVDVKQHVSRSKSGKMEVVREHSDKRAGKGAAANAPLPPISLVSSKIRQRAAGMTWRHKK